MEIKRIKGANMGIDLCSEHVSWEQDKCPWNTKEEVNKHRCAVKDISICPYFLGVERKDTVLCSYPHKLND